MDYNCYEGTSKDVREYGNNYTLTEWVTEYGQDANSVRGVATFDSARDPADPTTFKLSSGSVGFEAGSDGKDMGADTSVVGPA